MTDIKVLRARDLWTSILLIGLCLFFLYKTTNISQDDSITDIDWYNSAALVPSILLVALLILSIILFFTALREIKSHRLLSVSGLGLTSKEVLRVSTLCIIVFFYIFSLLPRVDFVLGSALVLLSLVYGYHRGNTKRVLVSTSLVSVSGLYALIMHFPQSEWSKPHDDDWVVLICWMIVVVLYLVSLRSNTFSNYSLKSLPVLVSVFVPFILVCAMAFGFKQNVPNRGGMLFSVVEYHYYVTIKPLMKR